MNTPATPFPTSGYYGPEYFCDREDELGQLLSHVEGGNSVTLIALRRMGKTALIRHLFYHLNDKYMTIYLDILSTESLNDLLNKFATAIGNSLDEQTTTGKKLWKALRSLRPVITYDPLQGTPLISIKSDEDESKKSIQSLFSILEEQQKRVIIALDEFQQITSYPEKNVDAWLRSLVQQLSNTSFIFAGSQQHVMKDMFSSPGRPFYRSSQFLKIGQIPHDRYRDFILRKFQENKKKIKVEVVEEMLKWTNNYTYYVQLLCNRVYSSSEKEITTEDWKMVADRILKEQEFVFYSYRDMLTTAQWNLMRAIAKEGRVYQPTSFDFVNTHSLGNPSSVLRSLRSLIKIELICQERDREGQSYYSIYDLLFVRWIESK